jgi:hypothetical protein
MAERQLLDLLVTAVSTPAAAVMAAAVLAVEQALAKPLFQRLAPAACGSCSSGSWLWRPATQWLHVTPVTAVQILLC